MPISKEDFIKMVESNHEEIYDYSKVPQTLRKSDYVELYSLSLDVSGNEIGWFRIRVDRLLYGGGSRKFANKKKSKGQEWFLKKAKEMFPEYDFSSTKYITIWDKVKFICPKHGEQEMTAHHLIQGHGCKYCSKENSDNIKRHTMDELIEKVREIHGDAITVNVEKSNYINNRTKIIFTCKKHGDFYALPTNITKGCGCHMCASERRTKTETELFKIIKENFQDAIYQYYNNTIFGKLSLDIFIPSLSVAIECQGLQHFQPIEFFGGQKTFEKQLERDKIKREICEKNNIKLFYYSNLGIDYPYQVYENEKDLLTTLNNYAKKEN